MKTISVFNNKGGVGKTTLTYHLANALAELGYKVLMIDADPQCNLTIFSVDSDTISKIWEPEDPYIDEGIEITRATASKPQIKKLLSNTRSLHFLLKPTEEGTGEFDNLSPPLNLAKNLDLIPGRLSLHSYEEKVASRWADAYRGDSLAIRTMTRIRNLAEEYSAIHSYDFVIIDTSPSLGALNKVIISTVDGFFVPAYPDLFSLYGIRNIGKSLSKWKQDFDTLYQLISTDKRKQFPTRFVTFLGYTIYNAKKYTYTPPYKWNLAQAHLSFAEKIPKEIKTYIAPELRSHITDLELETPIGETAVMHTHNTFPALAQHYHVPMWKVPSISTLDTEHQNTVAGAAQRYRDTKDAYKSFARDLLKRVKNV
jgi:cellulose biosynthesis protein BcsQ